ncbi:hypothetical protein NMY22_g454 [Coprinellus aureogranulatus]|nr:hypothetical protein NMY22_g454 [Coprinellus aureogranulatus]
MPPSQADCLTGRHPRYTVDDRYDSVKVYTTASANAVLKAGRELSSWILNSFSIQASEPPPPPPYIDNLPQEVLEEIFQEYLLGNTYPHLDDFLTGSLSRIVTRFNASTTPFTLAHVCASWRAIVMGRPALWSNLCAFGAEPHDIALFQFWLSRSASAPLHFEITARGTSEPEGDIDMTAHTLLSLALEHSDRWKSVSVALTPDMEPLFTSAGKPHPLSSLQSAALSVSKWTPDGLRSLTAMLSSCPTFRAVTLGSVDLSLPFAFGLPWANMRKIELGEINLTDLISLLRVATSLEHLLVHWLQGRRSVTVAPEASTSIHLPSLTTIDIDTCDDSPALFDMLTLPSLSTYSALSGFDALYGTRPGWAAFHDLVRRSGPRCRIHSFRWYDAHLPEEMLIGNFKKGSSSVFSELRHLEIKSAVGLKMVEALTLRLGDDQQLFPNLVSLEFDNCRVPDCDALQEMISSRPQLKKVNIVVYDEKDLPRELCFHL